MKKTHQSSRVSRRKAKNFFQKDLKKVVEIENDNLGISRLRDIPFALALAFGAVSSHAEPTGGAVAAGQAAISAINGVTTVQQMSDRAIVNWQSFNVNAGEAVKFVQPGRHAAILNRVTGGSVSNIDGLLQGNGRVYLINPNGIVVGANGVVNVNGGFVASTKGIADSAFMSGGALVFTGESTGSIQILGKVQSAQGDVILIAPKVAIEKTAELIAGQSIKLVAASEVELSNGKLTVKPKAEDAGQITVEGALTAAKVQLTANNNNLGALAINTNGNIRATGTQRNADGSVSIVATGEGGNINISGQIRSEKGDGHGGAVTVLADNGIRINGTINANSTDTSKVGGDIYIGRDVTTNKLARATDVSGATLLSNKGFVETSGHWLNAEGVQVQAKDWLIDPDDIVIGTTNPGGGVTFISASTISTNLLTANVTIATNASGTGGNGDISIESGWTYNGNNRLTLNAVRDINVNGAVENLPGPGNSQVRFNAGRDITVNSTFKNYGQVDFNSGRDITLNALTQFGYGLNAYAGRDLVINNSLDLGTAGRLWSAQATALAGEAWKTATGQVLFGASGKVTSYGATIDIRSGLAYDAAGVSTGIRNNFSDANLVWNNNAAANGTVGIAGFDNIDLSNHNGAGAAVNMVNSGTSLNVYGKNINVGTGLGFGNITIHAGSFETFAANAAANGVFMASNGWQNKLGLLTFSNNAKLTYANVLDLRSGLVGSGALNTGTSTGGRVSLSGNQVNWNANGNGYVGLYGFDTVTLDSAIKTTNRGVFVTANQINVQQNIDAGTGSVSLLGASFDVVGGSPKGSYVTSNSGWNQLKGTVDITTGKKITAQSFDIRSGVDNADSTKRLDFDGSVLLPSAVGVSGLYLGGFRDVTLPTSFTTITNAGWYQVYARNIDATGITGINAYGLKLWAGSFTDTSLNSVMVNRFTTGTTGDSWSIGANTNSPGIIKLPSTFDIKSSVFDFTSGIDTSLTSSGMRANFAPTSIGAYVDPSNPTKYTGAFYSNNTFTSGGTVRPGGARVIGIRGFNDITLPATPLNYEVVDIAGNNLTINADINAGFGSWWPTPHYLSLTAGNYSSSNGTAASAGSQAGKITFNNSPVIRFTSQTVPGYYGISSSPWGFRPFMTIINGTTAADFGTTNNMVRLGYTNADYTAGAVTGFWGNTTINGFDNTNLQMENAASDMVFRTGGGGPNPGLTINQRSSATGFITLNHDIDADVPGGFMSLDAGLGGVRMGSRVAKARTVNLSTGANSAVNIDADTINMNSRIAGKTLVVNEANNLTVNSISNSQGNYEINARGQITLVNNVNLTGSTAGLTLRSDAQFGRTVNLTETNFATETLNDVFENKGIAGELGGDGLGSIVVNTSLPTLLTPVFRQVMVVDANSFTVPAANTYFKPDGTAYANGTVLSKGDVVVTSTPQASLDFVTASGGVYRLKSTVTTGGWTVTTANAYFKADGTAYATGTLLTNGTEVFYKTTTTRPTGNIGSNSLSPDNGAQILSVITGYTTANSSVASYTSLGTSANANYSANGVSANISALSTKLSTDTPVDTSQMANYYGNPVTGAGNTNTLNMSGQFYTLGTVGQAAPTSQNLLAAGKSTSGNGWDTSWGTATLKTAGGDLRLFSGPKHALAGPGYAIGDPADLNIFKNATTNDFDKNKAVRTGAFEMQTGTGNLVALGFRDVNVEVGGTLTSGGNVTIGASRDLKLNTDVALGGAGKLTTLIAGGMITNKKSDGTYNTINSNTPSGSNLLLLAGGGVDVQTNVLAVAGSLQDNPTMTGPLSGGVTASGTFKVQAVNNLVVGGEFTNAEVNDNTFDGTSGILYSPTNQLKRNGINATYGDITLTATNNIELAAKVKADAGDIRLTATNGKISRTLDTAIVSARNAILTAKTTIGESSKFIKTDVSTLALRSADHQFISDAGDVEVASKTTNNGQLVMHSTGGTITVGSADSLDGIDTGSGEVNLKAQTGLVVKEDIITTLDAFLEAVSGNITSDGGVINADKAVLSAGSGMGSSTSRVQTKVNSLGINANGNDTSTAFVNNAKTFKLSAKAVNQGNIDVTSAGDIELSGLTMTPGHTGNASGFSSASTTSAIDANGGVKLAVLTGKISATLANTTITGGAIGNTGKIELIAGTGATSAGTIDGTNLVMTQNGNGGVVVNTLGTGDVVTANITNNGTGNVVLAAGSAIAAGTGAGGQVTTATNSQVVQNSTGKTHVFTGTAADTGDITAIDDSFEELFLSAIGSNKKNATSNADFAGGAVANSGSNTQVMFREKISVDVDLTNATTVYGTVASNADALEVLKDANGGDTPTTLSWVNGGKNFNLGADALIDTLTLDNAAFSTSGKLKAKDSYNTSSSAYTTSLEFPTLTVEKLALTGSIAASTTTYGSTLASGAVNLTNKVGSDVVSATGVTVTTTGNTSTSGNLKAGSYTGIQGVSGLTGTDADNYTFADVKGNYTVEKLALTGSIAESTTTYGGTLASGAVNLTNKVGSDVVSTNGVTVTTTGNTSTSGNLKAGSYTGIQSVSGLTGTDADNYSFVNVKGDYTVNRLALNGSISTSTTSYGSDLVSGATTFTNKISGDLVDVNGVSITTTGNTSTSGHLKAGSYTGVQSVSGLTGTDADNYSFANVKGDYFVSQKRVEVTGLTDILSYTGSLLTQKTPTITNKLTGNGSTDIVSIDPSSLAKGKLVGTYTSALSLTGEDAQNYIIDDSGKLTIKPQDIIPPSPSQTYTPIASDSVNLSPMTFAIGVAPSTASGDEADPNICFAWGQRKGGDVVVHTVLKPTYLGLRTPKTDTQDASSNSSGAASHVASPCGQNASAKVADTSR